MPLLEADCGMLMPAIGRSAIAIPESDAVAAHPATASKKSVDKAMAVRLTGRSVKVNMAVDPLDRATSQPDVTTGPR
jgi:predicted lipoprotein